MVDCVLHMLQREPRDPDSGNRLVRARAPEDLGCGDVVVRPLSTMSKMVRTVISVMVFFNHYLWSSIPSETWPAEAFSSLSPFVSLGTIALLPN